MNIKAAILSILNACGSYSLTAGTLKAEVKGRIGGPVGDLEFGEALVFLQDKGLVSGRIDALTLDARYYITGLGKTAAAQ